MSINYPLSMPVSPTYRQIELIMTNKVGEVPSEFTFQDQVQLWSGERWGLKASIAPGTRAQMEAWLTFLAALRGKYGTFLAGDPGGPVPRGVATGTPLVNGGGQTGTSLVTDGWTINVTAILKAGDYLQLGSGTSQRLYKNLSDVNSNGTGQATFDIWPRLRESPADNAPITLVNAMGLFRLSSNVRAWSYDASRIYTIGFEAIEAI